MLCSGDMFKLYYRLVFVESSRLSWSTKVLTEAKNLGTFHIIINTTLKTWTREKTLTTFGPERKQNLLARKIVPQGGGEGTRLY